jgi:esterase/lipase superfamily enzyme
MTTTTQNDSQPSLEQLIKELEEAVRAGQTDIAMRLQSAILQRLHAEASAREGIERRVQSLMQKLEVPTSMPPPTPRAFSLDDELSSSSVEDERAGVIYPVWYATNRKVRADGRGYTGERSDQVSRGRVDVRVPKAHRFGETGSSFWKRLKRLDLRDDHLRVEKIEPQERDVFFAEIGRSMQAVREDGEAPHGLVFLHGYLTTFEAAAIRAAQIGVDLHVDGATAFFSWPSGGSVDAYTADEASIEASERAITDFLVDFQAHSRAAKVHVVAHSMGNRGLLRALQRIAANAETRGKLKFGQFFLAAPDLDRDLFLDLAYLYPQYSERTTLYASNADFAVDLSSKVHRAARAGYFVPYTVAPGIDTVCVPNFNIDFLAHSYFAQAEALLHDIYDLMRNNNPPGKRQRIEPMTDEGKSFWRLRR